MRLSLAFAALVGAAGANEVPLLPSPAGAVVHPTRLIARLKNIQESKVDELVTKWKDKKPKRIRVHPHASGLLQMEFNGDADLTQFRTEEVGNVEYIEHDQRGGVGVYTGALSCPNQQTSNLPWGLRRVTSVSSDNKYKHDNNWGAGVDVYVFDTGVRCSHVELSTRCEWGANFVAGSPDIDEHGHGTHCAGTVAGNVWGVAKKAKIIAVKVLDSSGYGWYSDMANGMAWAMGNIANTGKPSVFSFSIGGGFSQFLNDAIADCVSGTSSVPQGIQVAVAAGNSNVDACTASPSSESTCVTVGSTTDGDVRSSFSNWGSCVDIMAPGSSVLSAYPKDTAGAPCDVCGVYMSGTSMAAPHVAGMMAAYLGLYPATTAADLKARILGTALNNAVSAGSMNTNPATPNKLLHCECGTVTSTTPPPTLPPTPPPTAPPTTSPPTTS
eukprot:Hpha_TRINITY_DN15849_c1_g10::TRINITY_DN15849_c1_g10_i1::g.191672::m.191672/K01336/E3.4.21.48; cerevisin